MAETNEERRLTALLYERDQEIQKLKIDNQGLRRMLSEAQIELQTLALVKLNVLAGVSASPVKQQAAEIPATHDMLVMENGIAARRGAT